MHHDDLERHDNHHESNSYRRSEYRLVSHDNNEHHISLCNITHYIVNTIIYSLLLYLLLKLFMILAH